MLFIVYNGLDYRFEAKLTISYQTDEFTDSELQETSIHKHAILMSLPQMKKKLFNNISQQMFDIFP